MLTKLFKRNIVEEPVGAGETRVGQSPPLQPELTANDDVDSCDKPTPPVIAVLGAKGGVGSTSIAVNLAAMLAVAGKKTTLVDCNLQQPDVAQLVGIEPEHSLMEMINRLPFPDKQLYDACCAPVKSGPMGRAELCPAPTLNLLSPPLAGEAALKANLSQLAECLKLVRCYSDFWVIDLPKHLDKHLVNMTDMCDKILLVLEPTVSGVAACRRWLNIFSDLGYDKNKIICVVNRAGAKYTSVEQQLDDCFAEKPIFRLPNASAIAWDCATRGVPIVTAHPKHAYTQAITKLIQFVGVRRTRAQQASPLQPVRSDDASELEGAI